jgi:hypothetical protein
LVALALLSACAGRAALEAYVLGPAGGGGTGGSTPTTTPTTTSTGTTSTGTTTIPTTTTTVPNQCDLSGDCNVCADCAVQIYCEQTVNDCFGNPKCTDFIDCVDQECAPDYDPDCLDQCAYEHPEGAALYQAVITCIYCSCQVDCDYQWCNEG